MKRSRNLVYITFADFTVRSAYQMGKTPLLPIFAATLGATDAFLGAIVSVSALTGMVLKPVIGVVSDRRGRRGWLILGTLFFVAMPFLYRFVRTPEQLFVVRIVHGLATAIYGPVTLAYVAEQSRARRAEQLGWFDMARRGGYIVGPAVAGWLLLTLDPVSIFTLIGLLSSLAFVPILLLPESMPVPSRIRIPFQQHLIDALNAGLNTPSVWLSGGLEATVYVALYAAKAFLPMYALSTGLSVALVGTFFALQEATHLVLKPFGGRFGDRLGYRSAIGLGMGLMGLSLILLTQIRSSEALIALATSLGVCQALIFPSTVALVSTQIGRQHVGAGMGLIGALDNAGKVGGPILGGLLLYWGDFTLMFRVMGLMLVLGAVAVTLAFRPHPLQLAKAEE